jgi:hypothetical protein
MSITNVAEKKIIFPSGTTVLPSSLCLSEGVSVYGCGGQEVVVPLAREALDHDVAEPVAR